MPKPVAVILVNWNTPVHTANCIRSLQQYCLSDLYDIIVVDNGSANNDLQVLQAQFPDLTYIDNKANLGFAEGNNRGLQHSIQQGYSYSLVLNTDTLVDEDIVSKLSTHLNHHPQAAAVQPAIYWLHDKDKLWNGRGKFNQMIGITHSDTRTPDLSDASMFKKAQWLTGCCMLIRNEALKATGLFNTQFFLYYEDVELSFRLRDKGYELHYWPGCKMYHEAGASAKSQPQKEEGFLSPVIHYYISRNHLWFLRGYGNSFFYPIYFICHGVYYTALLLYFKLRKRQQKAAALLKGLKEGLFTPKSMIWPKER